MFIWWSTSTSVLRKPFHVIILSFWHSQCFHFSAVRGSLLSYRSIILNHRPLISTLRSQNELQPQGRNLICGHQTVAFLFCCLGKFQHIIPKSVITTFMTGSISCITRKYLTPNHLLMELCREPWPCTLGTSASTADPRGQCECGLAIFNSSGSNDPDHMSLDRIKYQMDRWYIL